MRRALLGAGGAAGITEIYVAREVANEYYLRALTPSRVCSFAAKAAREGRTLQTVSMTQGDVATLIGAERTAATRALNRLADEGYVRLGYREIGLEPRVLERDDLLVEVATRFHRVGGGQVTGYMPVRAAV